MGPHNLGITKPQRKELWDEDEVTADRLTDNELQQDEFTKDELLHELPDDGPYNGEPPSKGSPRTEPLKDEPLTTETLKGTPPRVEPSKHKPSKASQQPSSVWAKVETTILRSDKIKIEDCKEDIDTLLVFAGLFSAVLSAFVLVSYQDLKEDQLQRSADTLQHMSAQLASYKTTGDYMNSTIPSYTRPPFQASPSAVRVNTLWFSSLVLSLFTASFGMLIKGWLREYLAVDFVSPQARLRVRHFRFVGLETWMVYEIAAALPLVLQIALGLFFYGLCVFTADIHQNVGLATLTLVIGWLSLFLFTVIAPLFSARCPYKTTFLKRALTFTRERSILLFNHITRSGSAPSSSPLREVSAITSEAKDDKILLAVDRIRLDNDFLTTAIWDTLDQLPPDLKRTKDFILQVIRHRLPSLSSGTFNKEQFAMLRELPESIKSRICATILLQRQDYNETSFTKDSWIRDVFWLIIGFQVPLTELLSDAISSLSSNMEDDRILLTLDRILLDNDFLTTAIWDTLDQFAPDLKGTIEFIIKIIRHRLPKLSIGSFDEEQFTTLRGLPDSIISRICATMLAQRQAISGTSLSRNPWMKNVFWLVRGLQVPLDGLLSDAIDSLSDDTGYEHIVFAIDRILLDNDFLTTVVWDAIDQLPPNLHKTTQFITQVLRHRLPDITVGDFSEQELTTLHELPESIKSRMCATIQSQWPTIKGATLREHPWIKELLWILAGMSYVGLSPQVMDAIISDVDSYQTLLQIDRALRNDRYLTTTIWDTVDQLPPDMQKTTRFIIQVLHHRIPDLRVGDFSEQQLTMLRGLPESIKSRMCATIQSQWPTIKGATLHEHPWIIDPLWILAGVLNTGFLPEVMVGLISQLNSDQSSLQANSIFCNVGYLTTTIWDTLDRLSLDPQQLVQFIIQTLRHSQPDLQFDSLDKWNIAQLRGLPESLTSRICTTLCARWEEIRRVLIATEAGSLETWITDILCVLASMPPAKLSSEMITASQAYIMRSLSKKPTSNFICHVLSLQPIPLDLINETSANTLLSYLGMPPTLPESTIQSLLKESVRLADMHPGSSNTQVYTCIWNIATWWTRPTTPQLLYTMLTSITGWREDVLYPVASFLLLNIARDNTPIFLSSDISIELEDCVESVIWLYIRTGRSKMPLGYMTYLNQQALRILWKSMTKHSAQWYENNPTANRTIFSDIGWAVGRYGFYKTVSESCLNTWMGFIDEIACEDNNTPNVHDFVTGLSQGISGPTGFRERARSNPEFVYFLHFMAQRTAFARDPSMLITHGAHTFTTSTTSTSTPAST